MTKENHELPNSSSNINELSAAWEHFENKMSTLKQPLPINLVKTKKNIFFPKSYNYNLYKWVTYLNLGTNHIIKIHTINAPLFFLGTEKGFSLNNKI